MRTKRRAKTSEEKLAHSKIMKAVWLERKDRLQPKRVAKSFHDILIDLIDSHNREEYEWAKAEAENLSKIDFAIKTINRLSRERDQAYTNLRAYASKIGQGNK